MKNKEICWLEKDTNQDLKFRQCCCVCEHHIGDFYQCNTYPKLRTEIEKITKKSTCICSIQKGWICFAPEFYDEERDIKIAHSNWPNHSLGCEMFSDKRKTIKTNENRNSKVKI